MSANQQNQTPSATGVYARQVGPWGENERNSYNASLAGAMFALRYKLAQSPLSEHEAIREEWAERQINRLDRLYMNLAMTAAEYGRYIKKIDKVTIDAAS